jgi:hypothetical protein
MKRDFLVLLLVLPCIAADSTQHLNEMFKRKSKRIAARWQLDSIENAANSYLWQPETFCYNDDSTGAEIWKMTSTPDKQSFVYDIGLSPWSADGKRMSYMSNCTTYAYVRPSGYTSWFMVNTDGTYQRPVINGCARLANHRAFYGWNPQIPDVYYMHGWPSTGLATSTNILYKNTVTNTDVSYSAILTYPTTHGSDLWCRKLLSYDGRGLYSVPFDNSWCYPAIIYPADSVRLLDADGYSVDRGYEHYGLTPQPADGWHDQYPSGSWKWFYALPTKAGDAITENAWWRVTVTGTNADGGCNCVHGLFPVTSGDLPYDFGQCWPENAIDDPLADYTDPYLAPYWSHFTPDPWGRYALGSMEFSQSPYVSGPGIWDVQSHDSVICWNVSTNHHAWNGFTDISITSSGSDVGRLYACDRTATPSGIHHLGDTTGTFVCRMYPHYNLPSSTEYNAIPRPGESPDGTKASWHSEFLNITDQVDLFWVVISHPKPPTNLDADATTADSVQLRFLPPKYTARGWPYYRMDYDTTAYGWPSLDENGNETGKPCYAREILHYNVWRSANGTSGWTLVKSANSLYSYTYKEDAKWFFYHPIGADSLEISASNKIATYVPKVAGTSYYAITSEEQCHLESNYLSEILQVIITAGSITTHTVSAAEGQTGFWTTAPTAPTGVTVTNGKLATAHRVSWTEPSDSKIRYYNLYYSVESAPAQAVQNKVASLPKGTTTFYDWLADSGTVNYVISSVDRYGNESQPPSTKTYTIRIVR